MYCIYLFIWNVYISGPRRCFALIEHLGIFAEIVNLSYSMNIWRKLKDEHCCSDSMIMSLANKLIPPSRGVHWALKALHPVRHSRTSSVREVCKGQTWLDFPIRPHKRCILFPFCASYLKERTGKWPQNLILCEFLLMMLHRKNISVMRADSHSVTVQEE